MKIMLTKRLRHKEINTGERRMCDRYKHISRQDRNGEGREIMEVGDRLPPFSF